MSLLLTILYLVQLISALFITVATLVGFFRTKHYKSSDILFNVAAVCFMFSSAIYGSIFYWGDMTVFRHVLICLECMIGTERFLCLCREIEQESYRVGRPEFVGTIPEQEDVPALQNENK